MARLLVVDDDKTLLAGMEQLLSLAGHEVSVAESGQAALNLLTAHESEPPELIVSDINMPSMTGLRLLEVVRSHAGWESIPFLFVSTLVLPETIERFAKLGMVCSLDKPFDPEMLCERVEVALAGPPCRA
jgi:CheY-like chemotaxis protein